MWSRLPLRNEGVIFGLKTGSRGTPWNRKNAGPGGSDFTKCRFWSFKWHFGLFRVPPFFSLFFDIFNFFILSLFLFLHFSLLSLFLIFWFSGFYCFLSFCHFSWFSLFLLFFTVFQFREGYLKDKALFWPLLPTIVHSHGKHLEGVIS